MNIGLVIFARTDSKRLNNKILIPLLENTLFDLVLNRIKLIDPLYPIILATSERKIDDKLEKLAKDKNISIFRGPINDVVLRAIKCCDHFNLDGFARICADRPFLPYNLIKIGLKKFLNNDYDLVTNYIKKTYPKGCMTEIIKASSLKKIYNLGLTLHEKEHITEYFYKNSQNFKIYELPNAKENWSSVNLSIDTQKDKIRTEWIIKNSSTKPELISLENCVKLAKKWDIVNKVK